MSAICWGVVVVATFIIVAHFVWQYWNQRAGFRSKFTYLTPAAPSICEAVRDLFAGLSAVSVLSQSFEESAARTEFPSCVRGSVSGARQSALLIGGALASTKQSLAAAEPMYVNYHAVYRGLCGADSLLLDAAAVYIDTGRAVHQSMVTGGLAALPGAGEPVLCDGAVADAGATLINMGKQLHQVVRAIHRLGAALDLE